MTGGLELRDLACVRGRRSLFKGLNQAVPAGQLLRLHGANGAGKTSLLRIVCGLLSPAQGAVWWHGQPALGLREEFGRQLVYLGHAAALKDELSAVENLMVSCLLAGTSVSTAEATSALAAAGLRGRERAPARILSQGQRKRVALARLALSPQAPLWVLDEPFNALDSGATAWLVGLIGAHVAQGGIVLLSSHQDVTIGAHVAQQELAL